MIMTLIQFIANLYNPEKHTEIGKKNNKSTSIYPCSMNAMGESKQSNSFTKTELQKKGITENSLSLSLQSTYEHTSLPFPSIHSW